MTDGPERPWPRSSDGDRRPRRSDGPRRESGRSGEGRRSTGSGAAAGGADRRREGGPARGERPRGGHERRAPGTGGERSRSRGERAPRELVDRSTGRRSADERAPRRDEPDLPDDLQARDLDGSARAELRTLSKENADAVARHLVMAGRVIDADPALAHRHALAAVARAGRVAVVRETLAITAYATADYALALRELHTYRRLSGSDDQIALLVDSERGIGRPDRALEAGRQVDRATLPIEAQVGLAIAMSGARLDRGEPRDALAELERAPIDLNRVAPWSAALYGAFATVLEELGDAEQAARWASRAARADELLADLDAESDTVAVEVEAPAADGDGAA